MRFKELTEPDMTPAQREVYREVCAGPRGRLGPPTNVMLRSPELANRVQKVGEYIRFGSTLPQRIVEFAVIITARYWNAQYAWNSHCPLAIKAGLSAEVAAGLAQNKRPSGMTDDETAAYQFCTELHRDKEVSDAAFDSALRHFGDAGVADLIGVCGYYTIQSMAIKVNQVALPPGVPAPWSAV